MTVAWVKCPQITNGEDTLRLDNHEKLHKMTYWIESHSSEKEGSSFPGSMRHACLPSSVPITYWVIHSCIHPIIPLCIIHVFLGPLLCARLHMGPWTCYIERSLVGTDEKVADVRLYSFTYILMSLEIQPRISDCQWHDHNFYQVK